MNLKKKGKSTFFIYLQSKPFKKKTKRDGLRKNRILLSRYIRVWDIEGEIHQRKALEFQITLKIHAAWDINVPSYFSQISCT